MRQRACRSRGVAGAARRRQQLEKALKQLRAGDELVVAKLTALAGSSLGELVAFMRRLEERGASLRSLAEAFNTKTATSSQIVEAMAAFERDLFGELTQIGMQAAKRRGQHVGRPPLLDDPKAIRRAAKRVGDGEAVPDVARDLGVSRQTLKRALQAQLQKARSKPQRRIA